PPPSRAPSRSPEPPIRGRLIPEKLTEARQATALAIPALTTIAAHWIQLAVKRPCAQVCVKARRFKPSSGAILSPSAPIGEPKLTARPSRSSRARPASSSALAIASAARSIGLRIRRRPYGELPTPAIAVRSFRSQLDI